nr:MAG TPA: tail fiber protein [Caudoviricetes sp.]
MIPGGVPLVLHVSQYDADRSYVLTPYYGSAKYERQPDSTAVLEATKPDSTVVAITVTYGEDGTISFNLPAAITQVAGDVRSKVSILDERGKRVSSAKVVFAVDAAGIDTYARVSESDLELLRNIEEQTANIAENVKNAAASAEAAKKSETNAEKSATDAKKSADAAKISETNANSSKEEAVAAAAAAKESKDNAKNSETAAGKYAVVAKNSETNAGKSAAAAKENKDNAVEAAARAEKAAEKAETMGTVSIATTAKAGIVKPDGSTISVTEDGTIKGASITFDEATGDLYVELNEESIQIGNVLDSVFKNVLTLDQIKSATSLARKLPSADALKSVDAKTEKRLPAQSLTASGGTLTFNDSSITENSLITPYATLYGISPTNVVATAGTCTVTFDAQNAAFDVCITVRN